MQHLFVDMDIIDIVLQISVIVLVFIIIQIICCVIANYYVNKNKQNIFDKTRPLSDECANFGHSVLSGRNIYWSYIDQLGLYQEYRCSSSVVSNASVNETKYLIKYSNIEQDESCLQKIDYCINWMNLYDQTVANMRVLAQDINHHLPLFVRLFTSARKRPYIICGVPYNMTNYTSPKFVFAYCSPAGKSRRTLEIEITSEVLSNIQSEIYEKMNKTGHTKAQRSAMTNDLREAIKKRDNYTCCICGNSVYNEPNLLLEVDHIIPIAKGGKTEANNLQTLCWRCNRAKSDKIES